MVAAVGAVQLLNWAMETATVVVVVVVTATTAAATTATATTAITAATEAMSKVFLPLYHRLKLDPL